MSQLRKSHEWAPSLEQGRKSHTEDKQKYHQPPGPNENLQALHSLQVGVVLAATVRPRTRR